jgi:hypothetical protein
VVIDFEKLQQLSDILCAIPCNEGENLISLTGVSIGFNWMTIQCLLNWKSDKRYYECRSLDEAIEIVAAFNPGHAVKTLEKELKLQGVAPLGKDKKLHPVVEVDTENKRGSLALVWL